MAGSTARDGPGILVVAGEASGDLHGAALMQALAERRPDLRFFGVGGDRMRDQGLDMIAHSRDVGVVGLAEVLRELPRIWGVFRRVVRESAERRPCGAVLVDFPDFNLRLAKQLKRLQIPVVYYVSPQIWAWRQSRVKAIVQRVERMLVLFDFEVDFYAGHDVDAVHVGHPIVEEVPENLLARPAAPIQEPAKLALLPGSRNSEVRRLLPLLLDAVAHLQTSRRVQPRLIEAATVDSSLVDRLIAASSVEIERVKSGRLEAVAECDLALCASGTATLEVGLIGTPMIVVYRLAPITYGIAKRLVKVSHVALVNLVLRDRVVPEMIQEDATPEKVSAAADALLEAPDERLRMQEGLSTLRVALGASGASERAADEVLKVLRLEEDGDHA